MVTFNHERFIAQAVESVMMQVVDFQIEVVIGEDCSTDKTRSILIELQRKYPDRLRLLLRERNLGMQENFCDAVRACRGKYIAFLEGDDYWLSPDKLQRQADFLESKPECALCFHDVWLVKDGQSEKPVRWHSDPMRQFYTLEDMARGNFIQTPSVMCRGIAFARPFPKFFHTLPMCDWPLWILCAQKGTLGYINEVMAAYRIHAGGVWSSRSELIRVERSVVAARILQKEWAPELPRMRETLAALRLTGDGWTNLLFADAAEKLKSGGLLKGALRFSVLGLKYRGLRWNVKCFIGLLCFLPLSREQFLTLLYSPAKAWAPLVKRQLLARWARGYKSRRNAPGTR